MAGFWNLALPFFSTAKTYEQVLKKLAGFAFYETYFITFLLRDITPIGDLFRKIESYGSLGAGLSTIPHAASLNIAGFVLALCAALISHVLPLHNRVSDLLGIRRRFDKDKILLPLAKLVGVELSLAQIQKVIAGRHSLMLATFYKYASSRADTPLVDKHNIEHALNAWSWFWVSIEAAVLFVLAAVPAFWFGGTILGWSFLTVAVVVVVLSFAQYPRLTRHARAEIETIAADESAARSVRKIFYAL